MPGTVKVIDHRTVVSVGESTLQAQRSAAAAAGSEAAANQALADTQVVAAAAQATAKYAASLEDGIADTDIGEVFVSDGTGRLALYLRTAASPFYQLVTEIPSSLGFSVTLQEGQAGAGGLRVTGGGGITDKGIVFAMANGSLSAIDVIAAGTGANVRFFRSDGVLETYVGEGNEIITAKWIGKYAGLWTDSGSPGQPGYQRIYWPPTKLQHMDGTHADVELANVTRGNNSADPKAHLYMLHDGFGYRLDMCDGTIRYPRPDLRPYIGDRFSDTPPAKETLADFATDFPICLEPFVTGGLYGVQLRSSDVPTIGELFFGIRNNGGLIGATTGRKVVQYENENTVVIGNDVDGTLVRGSQIDFGGPPKLPSFTVAGVPPANAHEGGLIFVSDEVGGKVPAFSDGTDWRRITDKAVIS